MDATRAHGSGRGEQVTGSESAWRRALLRGGLSIFILYHLTAVILAPNGENHIGARLQPVIEPYLNLLEFTNKWSFFAPEPGPPPVYVEFELLDRTGGSIRKGIFPEEQSTFFLRERQNRRIAATEFMIPVEMRVEKVMIPYLCEHNPEAFGVRLWRVAYSIPTMDEVASGKRRIGDTEKMERRIVSHSFCEGRK